MNIKVSIDVTRSEASAMAVRYNFLTFFPSNKYLRDLGPPFSGPEKVKKG